MVFKIFQRPKCWRLGHIWEYTGLTLGGIWVRCTRCGLLDEFLPGLHEPRGAEKVWEEQ